MEKNYPGTVQDRFWFSVAPGVWGMRDLLVNVYIIHDSSTDTWMLVDTGLKNSAAKIRKMATALFGPHAKPAAIVLTHGHFDHVGGVNELCDGWNVPVYAHVMERPYLNGQCSYPPPDPTVGGGMMSMVSWMYPKGPINLGNRLQTLPDDGSLPWMPEWRWIHTPGHAPGHISLYRPADKVVLAGDAFVTTKQESLFSVLLQTEIVSGPPKYFTYDWATAGVSVRKLAKLEPEIVATGHGRPMQGEKMRKALKKLTEHFYQLAVPLHGRYVDDPATADETGPLYIPPPPEKSAVPVWTIAAAAAVLVAAGWIILAKNKRSVKKGLIAGIKSKVNGLLPKNVETILQP